MARRFELLLGAAALLALAGQARAQDATWIGSTSADWNAASNWSTSTVPTGTATFTNSSQTSISFSQLNNVTQINELQFSIGSPTYNFNLVSGNILSVNGAGIVGVSTSANFNSNGGASDIFFHNGSTAGQATFQSSDSSITLKFFDTSTAGSATISGAQIVQFNNSSTAGSASIINSNAEFFDASTAGNSTINSSGPQVAGNIVFNGSSTAGNASILSNVIQFRNSSNAGNASLTTAGYTEFIQMSDAGSATLTSNNGNIIVFADSSNAGHASILNNSFSNGWCCIVGQNYGLAFLNSSSAASAMITNNGNILFGNTSTAGNAVIINNTGGLVDFSGTTGPNGDNKITAGSIAGAGIYYLGANQLTVGSNNLSTQVSGVISDGGNFGGAFGSLTKVGTGTLTLSGINTYSGATTINGGAIIVDGSIASSSLTTVNSGGTLGGSGTAGNSTISGGTLAPGSPAGGLFGPLTIQGNLSFTTASTYQIQVSPTNAARTNVTGTATLGGATVAANFAFGSYVQKQYTTLTAAGGVSGTFDAVTSTNAPANLRPSLSYDANDVFLNLVLAIPGLNGNEQAVGNALNSFLSTTGSIPTVFSTLSSGALAQAAGESATGTQQTTFDAMTQFMGAMTDPFVAGRSDGFGGSGGAPTGYASEKTSAARDANAMFVKVPVMPFEARWSTWVAGYGGSQTTDGNAAVGSNNTTSNVYGTVVGADYRVSPDTLAGFALAGGGTSFSVAGSGSGHSDLFQAGAFVRHTVGQAYISAALAYGWQDITTNRTISIAGTDQLQARFNANAFSGRVEGGYRFVAPMMDGGIGITPYAAAQFTTLDLPAYAEQALVGANTFALAYSSQSVTDTRSELGIRTDKSYAMQDAIVTLRGQLAWAHDYDPNRSIAATFQALPGSSFVVNGAAQASDSALTTVSAELKWTSNWSVAATFEGEFSDVTRSYAGKGVVRYIW